jgi:phosphatidate cytidylyltransferase
MSQMMAAKWPMVIANRVLFGAVIASLAGIFPILYGLMMRRPYPTDCPVGKLGWIVIGQFVAFMLLAIDAMFRYTKADREHGHDAAADVAHGWLLSLAPIAYVIAPMSVWWSVLLHRSTPMGSSPLESLPLGSSLLEAAPAGATAVMSTAEPASGFGMAHLIGIVLIVKMADAGAYFVGKRMGRTKLAPVISPGKTVEGLMGGFVVAGLSAYIYYKAILPGLGISLGGTLWGPAVMAGLLTTGGVVGDLTESMVKRAAGFKDSGASIPGLGGIWDVTDSLIPAAILGYLGVLANLY